MTREEAIQRLKEYAQYSYGIWHNDEEDTKAFDMAIEALSADADWIPCTERLPEDNVPVNITWVNREPKPYYSNIKDVAFTATGVYFKGKWYWWSAIVEDVLAEYGKCDIEELDDAIEVIAWMPLPEPYKGGDTA